MSVDSHLFSGFTLTLVGVSHSQILISVDTPLFLGYSDTGWCQSQSNTDACRYTFVFWVTLTLVGVSHSQILMSVDTPLFSGLLWLVLVTVRY